jgi:hypothetical protein
VQKYIENTGNGPMFVGNTMIPPGEGKLVEVLERAAAPVATAPQGPNLVELTATLLALSVAQILPQLAGLTHEALDLAESQEAVGKHRKTLLEAIQAERIARADAKLQAGLDQAAAQALIDARNDLLAARLALVNMPADAPDRVAAEAAVDEAQAKVDALAAAAPQE